MRERYIDLVKGLAILCIVFLHYEQGVLPNCMNIFIGSFMITAFYVTSGWVSAMHDKQLTFKELLKKRWRQLGVPYLWWTGIILLFDLLLYACGYYDLKFIGREVYKSITLRGIGTLWFLPALFGGEIIWYWLKKQNKIWLMLLALAATMTYQHYYNILLGAKTETIYRIIDAPFRTISNVLNAWVGIAFGYHAYKLLKERVLNLNNIVLFILGVAFCTFAFLTANYLPSCLSRFWGLLAPLFGPLGFLLLFKGVQSFRVFDILDYWGRNSLNLMVTHYSIVMVLITIVVEKCFNQTFYGWITIICFLISLPIQHMLVWLIDKYCKYTLGK